MVGFSSTASDTTCTVSGGTITITGSYTLAAGAMSFEGVIGNNPSAVRTVGSFTVNSFNVISSVDYAVNSYLTTDTSFTNPFTTAAQSLNSISVTINTPATNSFTGLTSVQYDFTVSHKSTFPAGSLVKITIPTTN